MQPAQNRVAKNVFGPLDGARYRDVLLYARMDVRLIVVSRVRQQNMTRMPFPQDDGLINISYSMEREIILAEHRISAYKQEILPAKIKITGR